MPLALSELSRLTSEIFLSSLPPSFSATWQQSEARHVSFYRLEVELTLLRQGWGGLLNRGQQ